MKALLQYKSGKFLVINMFILFGLALGLVSTFFFLEGNSIFNTVAIVLSTVMVVICFVQVILYIFAMRRIRKDYPINSKIKVHTDDDVK